MEMHQVRYFLAVCEELNFTRAAKRCDVAQPSLTNAIQRLEQELGGTLFHRSPTKTRLSELGCAMRPHLEKLDRCAQDARREAAHFLIRDDAPEPQAGMEASMRKLLHLAAGLALAILAVAILAGTFSPNTTGEALPKQQLTISIDDLHRSIDMTALPVQEEVKEPF